MVSSGYAVYRHDNLSDLGESISPSQGKKKITFMDPSTVCSGGFVHQASTNVQYSHLDSRNLTTEYSFYGIAALSHPSLDPRSRQSYFLSQTL
jgi:hypothetical protein